jgi:hypothetical protein
MFPSFLNNIDSKLCNCHPYGSSVLNCSFIFFLPCYSYNLLQYILINIRIFESFTKICFCTIIPVNQGNVRCRESSSLYHTCSFAYFNSIRFIQFHQIHYKFKRTTGYRTRHYNIYLYTYMYIYKYR